MSKKIILSIGILIAAVLSYSFVFAENMMQDATNTVNSSIDKTQDAVNNAGNAIKDAGNSVMNATNNVVNGTMNAVDDLTRDRNTNPTNTSDSYDSNQNMNNNSRYSATRTSNQGTLLGMNSTMWTWIIMGIVGIAIVALIWYYSMQTTDNNYDE